MTTHLEHGSNAGTVTVKTEDGSEPCPHAIIFTEAEDQALRWLAELFKAMETHHGVSMFYGRTAKAAIQKLYDHVETQHVHIHYLEGELERLSGIFDDIVDGKAFIAPRGQA